MFVLLPVLFVSLVCTMSPFVVDRVAASSGVFVVVVVVRGVDGDIGCCCVFVDVVVLVFVSLVLTLAQLLIFIL